MTRERRQSTVMRDIGSLGAATIPLLRVAADQDTRDAALSVGAGVVTENQWRPRSTMAAVSLDRLFIMAVGHSARRWLAGPDVAELQRVSEFLGN